MPQPNIKVSAIFSPIPPASSVGPSFVCAAYE